MGLASAPVLPEVALEALLLDLARTACRFDPVSGVPLWQPASDFLARWRTQLLGGTQAIPMGLALRAWAHIGSELRWLQENPRSQHVREHALLPLHKARELDSRSVAWLAKQPGRTAMDKAGSRRSVLAVVRPVSVDLPENELLRRVLLDLEREATRALSLASGLACTHRENPDRRSRLEALEDQCREALTVGPLAEVVPADNPQPNHVLLSHPMYSKVWTVWTWLKATQGDPANRCRLQDWALQGIVITLLGALREREGCMVRERFVRMSGLFPGQLLLEQEGGAPFSEAILGLAPDQALHLDFTWAGEEGIRLRGQALTGQEETLSPQGARTLTLSTTLEDDGGTLVLRVCEEDGAGAEAWRAPVTFEGLLHLAEQLEASVVPPSQDPLGVILAPADPEAGAQPKWQRLGCELSPPHLLTADATTPEAQRRFLGLASRHALPGDLVRWLCGAAAAWDLAQGAEQAFALARLLPLLEQGELDGVQKEAMTSLFAMIHRHGGGPAMGATLALAVPDQVSEAGMAQILACLPHGAAPRLVPKSVAAALAWREAPDFAQAGVACGDGILVLNGDGIRAEVGFLIARRSNVRPEPLDPWQWERVQLPDPMVVEPSSHYGQAVAFHGQTRPARVAEAIVDGGWHHAIAEAAGIAAWLPSPEHQGLLLVPNPGPDGEARADAAYPDNWLGTFLSSQVMNDLKGRCPGKLHILACGRFATGAGAWSGLEEAVTAAGLSATLHRAPPACCTTGALVLLDRKAKGLPTWCERIPELYLRTASGQKVKVFDGTLAEPGQLITQPTPGTFEIPPDSRGITFALMRRYADGSDEQSGHPWLADSRLCSARPTRVELQVKFRFAEEAFTITLVPKGPAAFTSLNLEWGGGSAHQGHLEQGIPPPPFPTQWDWQTISTVTLNRCLDAARNLEASYLALNDKTATAQLIKGRNGGQGRMDFLKGRLQAFKGAMEALEDLVASELWVMKRSPRTTHPDLVSMLETSVRPVASELLPKLMPTGSPGRPGTPLPRMHQLWSREVDPGLQRDLRACRTGMVRLLSRLRADGPEELPAQALDPKVNEEYNLDLTAQCQIVGRGLRRDLPGGAGPILEALLELLEGAITRGDARAAHPPLWALATAFWTQEDLVHALADAQVERLLEALRATLAQLDSKDGQDWGSPRWSNQTEVYREAQAVLLALLRLRWQKDRPPVLSEGMPLTHQLANLAERIEADLPKGHRKPRVKIQQAEGAKANASGLAAALRGGIVQLDFGED